MKLFGYTVIVGAILYGVVFLILAVRGVKLSKGIVLLRRVLLLVFLILLVVIWIIRPFPDTCPLESGKDAHSFVSDSSEQNSDLPSTRAEVPDLPGVLPHEALVTHIYTADPSAHVFGGKIYIYGSHDRDELFASDNDGGSYQMIDYHVLSMDGFDVDPVDHGVAFSVDDVPWAEKQLWAPDCAFKDGTYYFYFPAKDPKGVFYIGVAISEHPEGPFIPEEKPIDGSHSMDPSVFVDEDGQAYMYFGGIWGGQLERWQTGVYDENGQAPTGSTPALGPKVARMSDDMRTFKEEPVEIQILDENGVPLMANDESRRFFEGAWLHKHKGVYYLSYSTGTTHYLVYATADNPLGPFTYQGKIMNPVRGWTTHHSIVLFEDQWYLFYHDAKASGKDAQRNIKYAPLFYDADGTIQEVVLP